MRSSDLWDRAADSGEIRWESAHKTAFVFQEPRLMPWLTVWENVVFGLSKKETDPGKIEAVIRTVGLSGFEKAYPAQLSGGMQQRAVAAMGTASGAKWILADEPSKGLDMTLRRQMYDTLRLVRDRKVKGMLIITHDLVLAEKLCDQVAVMYAGQILEKGPSRKVLKDPAHPYTQGLLDSLPSRGMHPMKGIAPPPHENLSGCRLAPRCPYVSDRCLQSESEEMEVRGRKVRCFQYA